MVLNNNNNIFNNNNILQFTIILFVITGRTEFMIIKYQIHKFNEMTNFY